MVLGTHHNLKELERVWKINLNNWIFKQFQLLTTTKPLSISCIFCQMYHKCYYINQLHHVSSKVKCEVWIIKVWCMKSLNSTCKTQLNHDVVSFTKVLHALNLSFFTVASTNCKDKPIFITVRGRSRSRNPLIFINTSY